MPLANNPGLWVMIDMASPPIDIDEFVSRIEKIVPDLVIDRHDRLLLNALRSIEQATHKPFAERIAVMPMVLSDVRLWLTQGPQWNFESKRKGLLTGDIRPRSISFDFGDGLELTVIEQLRELCLTLPNSRVVEDCMDDVME